ncbi:MAG: nitroreductase family protein [Actinobacteria bacterium]|nr:nitroreductase family protein [Actinomycetota bacterium]
MDAIDAIRTRRTVKAFAPEPLSRDEVAGLLEMARWAPNHKLTGPWRFRVIGPRSLEALKLAAAAQACADAPETADANTLSAAAAAKLDRAPTLVVVSVVRNPDPTLDLEDEHATAIAAYIVLLTAHARGLAGYWRTPAVLRDADGLAAVGVPDGERVLGLLHLGRAAQEPGAAPARGDLDDYAIWLD